jgi:dTDP-4-dehydrorhamnose reductase
MAKYLVIGSSGTLGTEFTQLIEPADLVVGDRPELDITDFIQTREFIHKHSPNIVINCAAFTDVDGAESNYDIAKLLNHEALHNLSKVCSEVGATLVHFSTGMVFQGTNPDGSNEVDSPNPINKYGLSKLDGEKVIQKTSKQFYIIRTEWLYGKPSNPTAKKSFVEIMLQLAESGTVRGVTDEIGKPTWARDLAKATLELLKSDSPYGIYHLANEGQASRADWAREIYKIKDKAVNIEPVSGSEFVRAAKRPQYELLNNNKLPKMRSWQEALNEYLTT